MNRPSFRMGLALGVLGGAAAAVTKALQSRKEATAPAAPAPSTDWPPLATSPVAPTPAPAAPPIPTPPPAPEPTLGIPRDPSAADAARSPVSTPIERDQLADAPIKKRPVGKKAAPKASTSESKAPTGKTARKAAAKKVAGEPWVAPEGVDCPASHPVKAKLSSRIFHLPGMFAYKRTHPDRCYVDAAAAEADGLRAAKR